MNNSAAPSQGRGRSAQAGLIARSVGGVAAAIVVVGMIAAVDVRSGLLSPLVVTGVLMVGAVGLLVRASLTTLRRARLEADSAGQPYDALHDDVTITDISRSNSGVTVLYLHFASRQIVFLDDSGRPATAQSTGPGSLTVEASRSMRRLVRLTRSPGRRGVSLTFTERGVLTPGGRIVHDCLLAVDDGTVLRPRLTAATAFPG